MQQWNVLVLANLENKKLKSSEVTVSESVYVQTDEIEAAFGVENLPRSFGVGPIQPPPSFDMRLFITWPVLALVLLLIYLAFGADRWLLYYGLAAVSVLPVCILGYLHSFERKRWEDSDYSPYATE